jgi:hypothetical protein
MRGAFALAADAVEVNVVANDIGDVDRRSARWDDCTSASPGQALAPAAIANYNTSDVNMKTGE